MTPAPHVLPEPLAVDWARYVAVLEDRAAWKRAARTWERRCRRVIVLSSVTIATLVVALVAGGAR